jgi:hypothetical protein
MKLRIRIKHTFFYAIIICSILLLLEAGLRIYIKSIAAKEIKASFAIFYDDNIPGIASRYIPHHYLTYRLSPSYEDISGKCRHNKQGFRGAEISEHFKSLFRIIIIGGSTTYSSKIIEDNKTYPYLLDSLLNAGKHSKAFEVINAGVPGYTSWESFIDFAFRLIDLEPDMIIIHQAINDLHCRKVKLYSWDNSGYRHLWKEGLTFNEKLLKYSYIVRFLRGCFYKLRPLGVEHYTCQEDSQLLHPEPSLLSQNPPIYFERNIRHIIRLANSYNIKVVLCTFAANQEIQGHYMAEKYYQEGLKEMNNVIKKLSQQEKTGLIDLDSLVDRNVSFWSDGVHLNTKGDSLTAKILYTYLENSILLNKK